MLKDVEYRYQRINGLSNSRCAAESPGLTFHTKVETQALNDVAAGQKGMAAPASTPAEVVKTLHAVVTKLLETPDMQARLAKLGPNYAPEHRPSSAPSSKVRRNAGRVW